MAKLKDTTIYGNIKIDTDTLLTTPVAGTLEFHNDKLYATNVAVRRALDRTSDVITATTTVENDDTVQTLFTGTLGANALKAGNLIKIHGSGKLSNDSTSDNLNLGILFGSTIIQQGDVLTGLNLTNEDWDIITEITVRSVGETGVLAILTHVKVKDVEIVVSEDDAVVDTTAVQDITIKCLWANAKPGNTISIYQGYMEFKN